MPLLCSKSTPGLSPDLECPASFGLPEHLYQLVMKGVPEHLRSDNGPEFVGYYESFNSKLRDEFLNGELFRSASIARSFVNLAKCRNFRSHFLLSVGESTKHDEQTVIF